MICKIGHNNKYIKINIRGYKFCNLCAKISTNKYKSNTKNKLKLALSAKKTKLKILYGLSLANFNNMLKKQRNKCALCLRKFKGGKRNGAYVDHCHKTGKVRGLLCNKCNRGMGMLLDCPNLLVKAAKYLRKNM